MGVVGGKLFLGRLRLRDVFCPLNSHDWEVLRGYGGSSGWETVLGRLRLCFPASVSQSPSWRVVVVETVSVFAFFHLCVSLLPS